MLLKSNREGRSDTAPRNACGAGRTAVEGKKATSLRLPFRCSEFEQDYRGLKMSSVQTVNSMIIFLFSIFETGSLLYSPGCCEICPRIGSVD